MRRILQSRRRVRRGGAALLAAATVLFLAALPQTALGRDQVDRILECLAEEYSSFHALSVPYEREIITSSMSLLDEGAPGDQASGLIHFQPPDKLKIEQESPEKEVMLTDGKTLWWYIPRKQVAHRYSYKQMGRELEVLGDIFQGMKEVKETFDVIGEGRSSQGDDVLRLTPDPSWTQTDHIRVAVTPECRIRMVEIHDRAGGLTRFTLEAVKPRQGFEKGFFTFEAPEGVEIKDETAQGETEDPPVENTP